MTPQTPQEKMIEYAKQHNNERIFTHEVFCGKMITEGVVIERTPGGMTVARAKREGKTIIVTETVQSEKLEIVNGQLISKPVEVTTEVLRIEL